MASLELKGVEKSYAAHRVLHGIDLEVADGEFVVLVGPSGCGKSTLLRMIAGLEEISGGTVSIGERVVNDLEPRARDIAMVFQSYALYPHMTVAQNMGFSLKLEKATPERIAGEVARAAEILQLEPLLSRYPRQLSGGQRQRVAMGRAIVRDPQVFLFDEPLSNLDAKLRVSMRAEIKALHQRLGTTTVYVTHDQMEAMTLADRIVVMKDGVIEQAGRPLELYSKPANLFIAGFIGSPAMNLVDAVCAADKDGTIALRFDAGALPLPEGVAVRDGQEVVIGMRPEHLAVCDDEGLAVDVHVVEPTGAETLIHGRLAGAAITLNLRGHLEVAPGQRLQVAPQSGTLHVFDRSSGRRL